MTSGKTCVGLSAVCARRHDEKQGPTPMHPMILCSTHAHHHPQGIPPILTRHLLATQEIAFL